MNMRTNVALIEEATHHGIPQTLEAIRNLDYGVRFALDLKAEVLRDHRENCAPGKPEWCLERCRLAAEDW